MPPSATFDVLGTCFHFGPAIARISEIIGRIDPSTTQSPVTASAVFHTWFYASQRDFTYLSLATSYTPILTIFTQTFRRAISIVGLNPTKITDDDISSLMDIMRALPAREELKACFETLRGAGWDVLACTNGGRKGTEGYFERAGIEGVSGDAVVSCDEVGSGVAKPDGRVYEAVNELLDGRDGEKGKGQGKRWFVAAHSWDLIAARNAGFRTAWVAHEEGDVCAGLFGDFDIVVGGLKECAEEMVRMEREGRGQ